MALGKNLPVADKLIRNTTDKASITSKGNIVRDRRRVRYMPRRTATADTIKMTYYVKRDLLKKLHNFAYWDRLTVTEAFNTVLEDGLKGKNTKDREK